MLQRRYVAYACARRNGLLGLPTTRRMFVGLYLAMAFLYIRNIFRVRLHT